MKTKNKQYPILSLISNPTELRLLSEKKLIVLCKELRKFLLNSISRSSGHFASGFGVIELTVAIHYVYDTPYDRLIWDIGHQAYPHKVLTGRKDRMFTIRQKDGLHSFPWREESEYDTLSVGHSSTSISAGLGISVASKMEDLKNHVICVIGDGAITSGIAFEAMNHAGNIRSDILIILNDNEMSISNNVGALSKLFSSIRNKNSINSTYLRWKKDILENKGELYIENNQSIEFFFKNFGFNYMGPIDGHNLKHLIKTLKKLKRKRGLQVLHVKTKKGKGYLPAEKNPILWHAVPKFNPETGILPKHSISTNVTYSSVFGDWLCDVAATDKKIMVITPAMCEGSGLLNFSKKYPNQYFDVAIAEQHAVTFAAGLAIGGYYPIVSIYSTFLQRAYDQVIHDVAIQNLSVLFAIDRAGIVGQDGQTHQGAFDLSFLRCIPNMIIMTPSNENEFRLMLYTAYFYKNGPYAIRYPKGSITGITKTNKMFPLSLGKGIIYRYGKKGIAILNFGTLFLQVRKISKELDATLVDMRFVKPLDQYLIKTLSNNHIFIVTIEENTILGGAGSGVNEYVMQKKLPVFVLNIGFPDKFIPQGTQQEILSDLGLDSIGIKNRIKSWIYKIQKNKNNL